MAQRGALSRAVFELAAGRRQTPLNSVTALVMRCDRTMTHRTLFEVHRGALERMLGPDVLFRNVAPKRLLR